MQYFNWITIFLGLFVSGKMIIKIMTGMMRSSFNSKDPIFVSYLIFFLFYFIVVKSPKSMMAKASCSRSTFSWETTPSSVESPPAL